jgi:hypothetical protein
MPQESLVDSGALSVAMTGMASEFGAAAARRTQRADQTAADASAMWSIAMTTPTQNSALALRTATESGSGRTRAETNAPNDTGAGGPRTS